MKELLEDAGFTQVRVVYHNAGTCVFRAVRDQDGKKVIIKAPGTQHPSPHTLGRLNYEFSALRKVKHPDVVEALGMLEFHNLPGIIMTDIEGESLRDQILSTDRFFPVARRITEALGVCHKSGLIHNDINPANIIWNRDTGKLNLIDFGISSTVSREYQFGKQSDDMEGTLPFISPEQTGRINRATDFRSDYYALGATLYTLLTGNYIFSNPKDSLQWVHAHISLVPELSGGEVSLPGSLRNIIARMLAKDPGDRYQSASGILADLEKSEALFHKGEDSAEFITGLDDHPGRPVATGKLYGRSRQLGVLRKEIEKTGRGTQKAIMITGHSGSGKSSLVREVLASVAGEGGFFVHGKFQEQTNGVPFFALGQILGQLADLYFSLSSSEKKQWHKYVQENVAGYAGAILSVNSDLKNILFHDTSDKSDRFLTKDDQNGLYHALLSFIKSFCNEKRPAVVFLDDLQWTDLQTINFLEYYADVRHLFGELLFIGSYRHPEVQDNHPVKNLEKKLISEDCLISISTGPLGVDDTCQILREYLNRDVKEPEKLAGLLVKKTGGNPFHIDELLKNYFDAGLLFYQHSSGCWIWNEEAVASAEVSKSIIDLLLSNLQTLAPGLKLTLKTAAALGNRFNVLDLHTVTGISAKDLAEYLREALRLELILPESAKYRYILESLTLDSGGGLSDQLNFRFRHDRILQSAYNLDASEKCWRIHGKIADSMLNRYSREEQKEHVLEILRHISASGNYRQEADQPAVYIHLNLMAGDKTMESNAFGSAAGYYRKAIELLPTEYWKHRYRLSYDTHKKLFDALYLDSQFKKADEIFNILQAESRGRLDKAKIFHSKMVQQIMEGNYEDAVESGFRGLRLLGLTLKSNIHPFRILINFFRLRITLQNMSAQDILDQPRLASEEKILRQKLLRDLGSPAYQLGYENLTLYCILKQVWYAVNEGLTETSATGFSSYGILLSSVLKRYDQAYHYGQIALKLTERYPSEVTRCCVCFLHALFILPRKKSFASAGACFEKAVESGLRSGEKVYLSYAAMTQPWFVEFYGGIQKAKNLAEKYRPVIIKSNSDVAMGLSDIYLGVRCALQGKTAGIQIFSNSEHVDFNKIMALFRKRKFLVGIAVIHGFKIKTLYLRGFYRRALKHAVILFRNQKPMLGSPVYSDFQLYGCLALIRVWQTTGENYVMMRIMIPWYLRQFRKLALANPDHYAPVYGLIRGEYFHATGKAERAASLIQTSLRMAAKTSQKYILALIHESLARIYREKNFTAETDIHLERAAYFYSLWGAEAKSLQIAKQRSYTGGFRTRQADTVLRTTTAHTAQVVDDLDMITIIKASQILSEKKRGDQIIENLLRLIAENSGATRVGMLMKEPDKELVQVYATWNKDGFRKNDPGILPSDCGMPGHLVQKSLCLQKVVLIHDLSSEQRIVTGKPGLSDTIKSLLLLPVIHKNELLGLLYLEHDLLHGAFNESHTHMLGLLSSQAAIALQNAEYFENLEKMVKRRTHELKTKNEALSRTVDENKNLVRLLCHDLSNSVALINMHADLALKKGKELPSDKAEHFWKRVKRACGNQREIIDHVREMEAVYAGKKSLTMRPLSLESLISHVRFVFEDKLKEKGITLECGPEDGGDMTIMAEEASAKNQIFSNIVSNALKFSERGSVIRILADRLPEGKIRIRISDEGKGMPEVIRKGIFDVSQQTSRPGTEGEGGTGFGMPLAHLYMGFNHGEISVSSREYTENGKPSGTTFTLIFHSPEAWSGSQTAA